MTTPDTNHRPSDAEAWVQFAAAVAGGCRAEGNSILLGSATRENICLWADEMLAEYRKRFPKEEA